MTPTDDVMVNGHNREGAFIEGLKEKHGDGLFSAEVQGVTLYMRPLKYKELELYASKMTKPEKVFQTMVSVVHTCCVSPGRDQVESLIQRFPGFVMNLGQRVLEESGFIEVEIKKY